MLCSLLRVRAGVSPDGPITNPRSFGVFFQLQSETSLGSTGEEREPGPLMLGAQGTAYLQSLLGPPWHGNVSNSIQPLLS